VANKISHCTNLAAAEASVKAIRSLQELEFKVTPLQDYYL
jgi:carbamoyl-phosphate synthase large subunit